MLQIYNRVIRSGRREYDIIRGGIRQSAVFGGLIPVDNLEHDIYYPLYASDILPEWLFGQRRKAGRQR